MPGSDKGGGAHLAEIDQQTAGGLGRVHQHRHRRHRLRHLGHRQH